MKLRILAFLLAVVTVLSLALVSCGKKKDTDDSDTDTEGIETETEAPIYREVTSYYGMYDEKYDFIFEDICIIADTFTANRTEVLSASDAADAAKFTPGSDLSLKQPKIYRYIKDLSLTREEVEAYYNTALEFHANQTVPTKAQYDALFSGDDAKAMEACVHETALYKDGHVYSVSDLLLGKAEGVSDAEIKETCNRALAYYGEEFTKSPLLTDDMASRLEELGFKTVSDAEKNKKTLCSVHGDEYHTYPEALIKLVGESKFNEWKKEAEKTGTGDECSHGDENIYNLIHALNVKKDDFIELYNTDKSMIGDYPIDLLFDGSADEVDAYYRASTAAVRAKAGARKTFVEMKEYIVKSKGLGDFIDNVMEFSLPEILLVTDFTAEDFADYKRFCDEKEYSYDIDFYDILARSDEFVRMMRKHTVYFIDCSCVGEPAFETPYEAQSAY